MPSSFAKVKMKSSDEYSHSLSRLDEMTSLTKDLRPTFIMVLLLVVAGILILVTGQQQVHWGGFISMIIFYALIFYLGTRVAGKRQSGSMQDMMLADRSIPLLIAVFTMSATWVGGGYINGTAEYAYSWGLVWVQAPWGYALSLILGGLFFARKMRRYRYSTMLDPLQQRFGLKMSALAFLPALSGEIFWTAAILTALGTTFSTVLGLSFFWSILLSAAVAITYTAISGLWAVAFTDVVQLLLLLIGLGIVIPGALDAVGGWSAAWQSYAASKGAAASLFPSQEALGESYWTWWDYALLLIFGGIPWQVYFQRVLSSRDEQTAVRLSLLAGFFCLLAAIPAIVIGIVGDAASAQGLWQAAGAGAGPDLDAEILPYVIRYLTHPVVAIIGLGAIAAAVMSSVDSSILSASSMATWNIYKPLINSKAQDRDLLRVLKRCIWIIGTAATLLALQIKSVYALWFLCSDLVYCLLFPLFLTAFFDPKANRIGALCGFLVAFILRFGGGEATLGLPSLIPYATGTDGSIIFPFRTLAMVSGLVTILIVSRVTSRWYSPTRLEAVE